MRIDWGDGSSRGFFMFTCPRCGAWIGGDEGDCFTINFYEEAIAKHKGEACDNEVILRIMTS